MNAPESFEERYGRYVEFLMERGVDLYYSEPTPDMDEYFYLYVDSPPSHLRKAPTDVRIARAGEAFEAAASSLMQRITEATQARLYLATITGLIDLTSLNANNSFSDTSAQLHATRSKVIRLLWKAKLWYGAWRELVNHEIPGDEPTGQEIDEWERERAAEIIEEERTAQRAAETRETFEFTIVQNGLIPQNHEQLLLQVLALEYIREEADDKIMKVLDRDDSGKDRARESIDKMAVNPSHPAWEALLAQYF